MIPEAPARAEGTAPVRPETTGAAEAIMPEAKG